MKKVTKTTVKTVQMNCGNGNNGCRVVYILPYCIKKAA